MSEPDSVSALEVVEGQPGTPTASERGAGRTAAGDAWESLRTSWVFWSALVLIAVFVVMAAFPGLFAQADPADCQAVRARVTPSADAWFGYDVQGCDVYARTVYGARASIMVGSLATLVALLLGASIGVYAGFYGGVVDTLLSRVTDIFFAIPILLGSIIILVSIPTPAGSQFLSILKVAVAIAVLAWTSTARVARSAVIQVKQADFVNASRALGASQTWMIRKHIIPNAAAPVIVVTTISLGSYIGAEATLSYLGIGLQPPVISWGIAINDAAPYVRSTPHMLFFPAVFLSLTVLAFISLGDSVREALDPKGRDATGALPGGAAALDREDAAKDLHGTARVGVVPVTEHAVPGGRSPARPVAGPAPGRPGGPGGPAGPAGPAGPVPPARPARPEGDGR